LTASVGLAGGLNVAGARGATLGATLAVPLTATAVQTEAFFGPHQSGIATPVLPQTYFAAFDIIAEKTAQVAALMRDWTEESAKLTQDLESGPLTLTFGFGQTLFTKDGTDRFGLAHQRPAAFVDLPKFVGDQLVAERTGGDLSVQACGLTPQATLDTVRALMRRAEGVTQVRWVQAGFVTPSPDKASPRNLMGFKDGSFNVSIDDPAAMARHVWVGEEGPPWMRGGSYVVARPTRIALEHWDKMKLAFQEQTVGRHKDSGAVIGEKDEFGPLNLDATDADGNTLVAENAHVRLAAPQNNDGAEILRRSYSYDNGVSMVAERWPPWRHAMELDVGLLFMCYQRDPRSGFIKIFDKMSKFDMMNQFVTPIGGGMFACPAGATEGRYLAQDLFEAA
jgi:deferrochelatase/peroxidase EfeB